MHNKIKNGKNKRKIKVVFKKTQAGQGMGKIWRMAKK
jgi:hypothetical protein